MELLILLPNLKTNGGRIYSEGLTGVILYEGP